MSRKPKPSSPHWQVVERVEEAQAVLHAATEDLIEVGTEAELAESATRARWALRGLARLLQGVYEEAAQRAEVDDE